MPRALPLILIPQFLLPAPVPAHCDDSAVAPAAGRGRLLDGCAASLRAMLDRGVVPIIDVEHHWGRQAAGGGAHRQNGRRRGARSAKNARTASSSGPT